MSRWLKQVGESVAADEPLLEISTDKVDTEIPSPAAGVLLEIRVQEDETVEVGAVLAVVGEEGARPRAQRGPRDRPGRSPEPETATETGGEAPEEQTAAGDEGGQAPIPAPEPEASKRPSPHPKPKQEEPEGSGRGAAEEAPKAEPDASYVTPLVRKLAREHNVELIFGDRHRRRRPDSQAGRAGRGRGGQEGGRGSGGRTCAGGGSRCARPGGREGGDQCAAGHDREDVPAAQDHRQADGGVAAGVGAAHRDGRGRPDRDLPDPRPVQGRLQAAREGASLSYLPFITKAAVEALKVYPKVNATIDTEAGEITYPDAEHVGIAVDTEKGLLVPVIKDAGDLNIAGLAKKIGDLAARTRQNKVTPDELSGGTFTITNYGSAGTLMDTPIVNQPQVAILGTGALVKRPVVLKDANLGEVIAVRDMMYLSMSYDHRLVDGADAARFLSMVKARLEEGDFASELGA